MLSPAIQAPDQGAVHPTVIPEQGLGASCQPSANQSVGHAARDVSSAWGSTDAPSEAQMRASFAHLTVEPY